MRKYLKVDMYRMVTSKEFYIGMVGIALLYLIAGYQAQIVVDVFMAYFYNAWFSTMTLIYAFCAVSYSGCFIEDSEYKFWMQAIQKGDLHSYAWSKTLTCLISGILTMVGGILLFVFLLQFHLPLYTEHSFIQDTRMAETYGFLIYPNTILLYFICTAAHSGILGGIFAMASAYLSLYEKSRIFAISLPVAGFYFVQGIAVNTLHLPPYCNILYIYGQGFALFENSLLHICYAIVIAAIFVIVLEYFIEKKLWREIYENKDAARFKKSCDKSSK